MALSRKARLISVARGELSADLILANAGIVNVFTGEIESGNLAIYQGMIAGVGDYRPGKRGAGLRPPFALCHPFLYGPAGYPCTETNRPGAGRRERV